MEGRSQLERPFHFGAQALLVQQDVIPSVATPACRRHRPVGFLPCEACKCGVYGAGSGLVARTPWPSTIV